MHDKIHGEGSAESAKVQYGLQISYKATGKENWSTHRHIKSELSNRLATATTEKLAMPGVYLFQSKGSGSSGL